MGMLACSGNLSLSLITHTYVVNPRAPFSYPLVKKLISVKGSTIPWKKNWFRNAHKLMGCDIYQFQLRIVGKQEATATSETVWLIFGV